MKTSEKGIDLIKGFESFVPTAYRCPAGELTIGYGHTDKDVRAGMVITETQAEELLRKDLETAEGAVNRLVTSSINQHQFDALVSFTFNVGEGNFKKSTLLRKVNRNPNERSIREEFARWTFAGGKNLPGLVKRRLAECELYFS